MANIGAIAKQLYAEIVLRDKTQEGADSARKNIESVGAAADKANKAVDRTSKATESAERAYERLQRRIDPLVRLQEKLERDERTLARAREQGVIAVSTYERNLAQLHAEYDRGVARAQKYADGQKAAAQAVNDNNEAVVRQQASLSSLANSTIEAGGNVAKFFAALVGLKIAQLEAVDNTKKWTVALGVLGRFIPIAGVLALGIALVKLGADGVKAIRSIIDSSVDLAKTQREAERQAVAAISSTGGAARRSIEDIRALASEIQNLTNIADEVTIRAGAQLLTFTNIRGENFDRALTIGADVAARLNRDPEQVALQLGKALNDPVRNLGALTESGIQFSDGQRNLIQSLAEVGEIATAQAIILKELENQFQGAAAAQREADGGAQALANSWGDLKEVLGERIIAQTADDTDRLAKAVADPVWKGFFGVIGDVTGAFKGFGISVKAALLEFGADTIRGAGIVIGAIADAAERAGSAFGRMISGNVSAFFAGIASAAAPVVSLINDIGAKIDEYAKKAADLYARLPAGVRSALSGGADILQDAAPGGLVFGPTLALAGAGRRSRLGPSDSFTLGDVASGIASGASADDLDARSRAALLESESIEKIAEHYEAAARQQQEYYEYAERHGAEALERRTAEQALLNEIDEITKGLPAAEAERVRQAKLTEASYKRQLDDLKKLNGEREKRIVEDVDRSRRAATGIASSTVGDINDQRRAFADAFERALEQYQPDLEQGRADIETAKAIAAFDQAMREKLDAANDSLGSIDRNTGDDGEARLIEKIGGLAESLIRPFDQVTAGLDQIDGTIRRVGGSLIDKIGGIATGAANIFSGAGEGISKIFGDGAAGLSKVLGSLGSIAGAAGQAAGLISSAVSLFQTLFGKTSDFTANAVFNPVTGDIAGTYADKGAQDNAKARDAFLKSLFGLTERVASVTGATVGNIAGTPANEAFLNTEFKSDRKTGEPYIVVGYQGPTGSPTGGGRFTDVEAALDEAVRLTIGALKGGNEALVAYAKLAASAGKSADEIFDGLDSIADALDVGDLPVDALQEKLDKLVSAFDGLDTSAGALGAAFEEAVDKLAANANADTQKALDAILNPQRAALADQIAALDARRAALENVNAEGGNVDLTLFDELARRQLLGGFNIDRRLAEGADPAAASIQALRETQRQELAALTSAVGRFGVTMEDVASLQRAQVFERRAFFEGLPEEDRLRLSGQADDFLDLSGQYELAVDRLLEQSDRLVEGFEERANELRDFIDRERAGVADYNRAIADIDRRFGQGDPAARVETLSGTVEDLRSRALVAEDTADRQFAREQLPQAVNDLIETAQKAGDASPLAQNAVAFGRAALVEVRNAREADATAAERSLAALEQSRDILEDIRDILASPELDAAALAERALSLPADYAERDTVVGLARTVIEIQEAQFEQNERITAALEALSPEDVGLTAPSAANDNPPSASPAAFTGAEAASPGASASASQGGAPTASAQDSDVVTGLYYIAKRLQAMEAQDKEFYSRQIRDNSKADNKLGLIANKQAI